MIRRLVVCLTLPLGATAAALSVENGLIDDFSDGEGEVFNFARQEDLSGVLGGVRQVSTGLGGYRVGDGVLRADFSDNGGRLVLLYNGLSGSVDASADASGRAFETLEVVFDELLGPVTVEAEPRSTLSVNRSLRQTALAPGELEFDIDRFGQFVTGRPFDPARFRQLILEFEADPGASFAIEEVRFGFFGENPGDPQAPDPDPDPAPEPGADPDPPAVIPTPTAAGLGLALLGTLPLRRRR